MGAWRSTNAWSARRQPHLRYIDADQRSPATDRITGRESKQRW